MAERRRRREAGLAGVDLAAIFGGQPCEIEDLGLEAVFLLQHPARDGREPPALGHLARAGMVASRRAVDEENAAPKLPLLVPLARSLDRRPGLKPVHRQLELRVGKTDARLGRAGALARMRVAVPCRLGNSRKLGLERSEGGIPDLKCDRFTTVRSWEIAFCFSKVSKFQEF